MSMGFSRQEYWSGLPCPPPGDLCPSGIKHKSSVSPALQEHSLPLSHQGSPDTAKGFNNQIRYPQSRYLYKEITRGCLYLSTLKNIIVFI